MFENMFEKALKIGKRSTFNAPNVANLGFGKIRPILSL